MNPFFVKVLTASEVEAAFVLTNSDTSLTLAAPSVSMIL